VTGSLIVGWIELKNHPLAFTDAKDRVASRVRSLGTGKPKEMHNPIH